MKKIALLAAFAIFALGSCRNDRTLPAPSAETPVFLISIDTLRSDHLPMYGYKELQTPNLDALRKDGVLYEKAYSHTPLTFPSHSSILTGLLPADTGVRDNLGFTLKSTVKPVAEILQQKGYATGAAVSAFVLRREGGLARGFDFYDDNTTVVPGQARMIGNIQRAGGDTEKIAAEWIGKQKKPVFFFLHLYDPHTPYAPPEPFATQYATNRYDGEIAYADSVIGDYIKHLKDAGLYDKALIILLSDHGEGLGEHGEEEHGLFLYREAIQVPLVVKLPGQKFAGASVETPVELVDVVPTILERTGIAAPTKLPGRSLASLLLEKSPEKRAVYSETYYPRFHFGWAEQHSLIDGERHYIQSPRPELFDVKADVAEKNNIFGQDRRATFAMKNAMVPLIREVEAPAAVDPEEAAKLAALGYLGSTVQTKPGEVLPDPKDHLDSFKDINRAFQLFNAQKYQESLDSINRTLQANPRILDLYDLKGKALTRLGRIDEAIEAGKEGLRLSPTASHIAIDVANLLLETNRWDDAQKHAELALKTDAGQAHELLSRVWIGRKDYVNAEKEARLAIQTDRDQTTALVTLARVQREKGEYEAALKTLDEAQRQLKPNQEVLGLRFLRGDVLARMGRGDEAEQQFRAEIAKFPEDPASYKNLVLLLVAEGRVDDATQVIRELIAASPTPPSYLAVCQVLETLGDQRGVRFWASQGLAKFPNHPGLRKLAG